MSSILEGVKDLIASLVEIVSGIIGTIISLFQGFLNLIASLIKNAVGLLEGVIGFVIANIFIIGTIAAVFFGYVLYQQRQGKTVNIPVAPKKTN